MSNQLTVLLCDRIIQADCPEDVFGEISEEDKLQKLKLIFYNIAKSVHPDHCEEDDKVIANDAMKQLDVLYSDAQKKIKEGKYGMRVDPNSTPLENELNIKTSKGEYRFHTYLDDGDFSNIFQGILTNKKGETSFVVAKVANDKANNDLIDNEVEIMKKLDSCTNTFLLKCIDTFQVEDRSCVVLPWMSGLYNIFKLRDLPIYKNGIPQEHMVWIYTRCLDVLGDLHTLGVIHGNIHPGHIFIHPPSHAIRLIDFTYAVAKPTTKFLGATESYSPPEAFLTNGKPTFASDMYSLSKTMVFLLGGDVKTDEMPPSVDRRIQNLIKASLLKRPVSRNNDAWKTVNIVGDLRQEIFGVKHPFLQFKLK